MALQPRHKLHRSPLQLFEQNFNPLIDQSRNIVIHYRFCNDKIKNGHFDTIDIVSVNGCSTPEEFRIWLNNIVEPSLENLFQWLKGVRMSYWKTHLDYIREKVEQLTCIIVDERFVFQDDESGLIHEHNFKSFSNCKVYGPRQDELHIFRQYIRFKAVKFAEAWLDVLYGILDNLDLMHELLLQAPESSVAQSPVPTIQEKPRYSIKSNLTVPQLAYLFRILTKTDIIKVPPHQNNELINWITENFQSKNRETIRNTSLRNKYYTPEPAAIDFWEEKIHDILERFANDRDHILK